MNSEVKESMSLISQGLSRLSMFLLKAVNSNIHKYPYPYIVVLTIICLITNIRIVFTQRASENISDIKEIHYRQSLDSLQMIVDNYRSMEKQDSIRKQAEKTVKPLIAKPVIKAKPKPQKPDTASNHLTKE